MNIKLKRCLFVILLGMFACVYVACNSSREAENVPDEQEPVYEQTIKEEPQAMPQKPMLISQEQFRLLVEDFTVSDKRFKGEKPCVIDFYADWCRPCKMLAPLFESMAEKYGDKVNFYKINVDYCQNLCAAYNITGIPALFFYDKEGRLSKIMGIPSEEELEDAINTIIP